MTSQFEYQEYQHEYHVVDYLTMKSQGKAKVSPERASIYYERYAEWPDDMHFGLFNAGEILSKDDLARLEISADTKIFLA